MAVTIYDLARCLKLSHSTVSRAMNHPDSAISEQTRERVLRLAREMGYSPNYHSRSLQTGCAMTLGLISCGGGAGEWFWRPMLGGVEQGARALGYDVLVVGQTKGRTEFQCGLDYCREQRIDALVVPGFAIPTRFAEDAMIAAAVVVVAGNSGHGASSLDCVDFDPAPGIAAALEHLAALGHHRILWFDVHGRELQGAPAQRRELFCHAAQRMALDVRVASCIAPARRIDEQDAETALRCFPGALDGFPEATAVVCYNEASAFGVYAALAERGLRVPTDMSVISFDDIHATIAAPPMTVVSHMLTEIGFESAKLAIERSQAKQPGKQARTAPAAGRTHLIPAKLIVRKSTAAPGPRPNARNNG